MTTGPATGRVPAPSAGTGAAPTSAPTAPGRLGDRLDPGVVQAYIADLQEWVSARKAELDELDAAALTSPHRAELTSDLMLSMALWKAVADREQLLLATWDGGRVGPTERERLSALIWGRLDATLDPALLSRGGSTATDAANGLAVSLPEACRLSDALAGQLRARLALSPAADANARRVRDLRASIERLRDQVGLEPPVSRGDVGAAVARLAERVDDIVARLARGGDVGGLLGPLENDSARLERDLIVGGARRRDALDTMRGAAERRADLEAREDALTRLAEQAVRTVDPAPRYAVPDVEALGPVPTTEAELTAYLARLDRVALAMNHAHESYAAALSARADLLALLAAHRARAEAAGVAGHRDVAPAEAAAREVLDRTPTPVAVARALVATYEAWTDWAASHATRPAGRTAR